MAEVSRYVHLNPVRVRALGLDKAAQARQRVGLASAPDRAQVAERLRRLREYRWSSYRAYGGLEPAPEWLAARPVLALLGGQRAGESVRRYRAYVEEAVRDGLAESPWERLQAQAVLGGPQFVKRMRPMMRGNAQEQPALRQLRARPTWEAVVRALEVERGEGWETFRDRYGDWGRDAALYLARRHCGLRLQELGRLAGGIDYRSVGGAVHQFAGRLRRDPDLAAALRRLETQIKNQEM